MLEHLIKSSKQIKVYNGPAATVINSSLMGRAYYAFGMNGLNMLISGGFSAPANPYPSTFTIITLAANGKSISSSQNITGYDGTNATSVSYGNSVYIAQGHDGAYQRYIKVRNITTGQVTATLPEPPGEKRVCSSLAFIDNDNLVWGLGFNATINCKDLYRYNLISKTWTRLADMVPADPWIINSRFNAVMGSDGKIYTSNDSSDISVVKYDPENNKYLRTSSLRSFVTTANVATLLLDMATVAVGKYILFFGQLLESGFDTKMACYRYDTTTDTYTVFRLLDISARWGARAGYNPSLGLIYVVGGTQYPTTVNSAKDSPKFNGCLVYNASSFLVD